MRPTLNTNFKLVPVLLLLFITAGYKTLLLDTVTHLFSFGVWTALAYKAIVTVCIAVVTTQIYLGVSALIEKYWMIIFTKVFCNYKKPWFLPFLNVLVLKTFRASLGVFVQMNRSRNFFKPWTATSVLKIWTLWLRSSSRNKFLLNFPQFHCYYKR